MSKASIKSDAPPLRMKVANGRLEPITQYDAERLDSYRNGSEIWVHPTQDVNVALRKFWAVLGKTVKDCKTPWKNTTQAADSLKLALGHTHQFKDEKGRWRQAPRSLTEFSLPEMEDFNLKVWAVLFEVTGVDPLTMQAEAPMHDAAPSQVDQPSMDAPVDSMDGNETVNQNTGEVTTQSNQPDPTEIAALTRECALKFWDVVMDQSQEAKTRRGTLEMCVPAWKDALPTRLDTVKNLLITADRVITGRIEVSAGRMMIAGYAGIAEGDLK